MKKIKEDKMIKKELTPEDLDLIKQVEELLDKDLINQEKEVDEDGGMTSSGVLGVNSTSDGFMDGKTNFVMPKKLKHIDSDEEVKILKRFELQENSKKKKTSKKTVVAPPYWFPIDNIENNSENDIGDIAVDAGIAVGESDEEDDESFE
jgi:hypothetical protein